MAVVLTVISGFGGGEKVAVWPSHDSYRAQTMVSCTDPVGAYRLSGKKVLGHDSRGLNVRVTAL